MSDYMTLVGAEKVESAGYAMRDAAEKMRNAASQIDEALSRHQQFMQEWLGTLEQVLREVKP